jgi:hypothetical protein
MDAEQGHRNHRLHLDLSANRIGEEGGSNIAALIPLAVANTDAGPAHDPDQNQLRHASSNLPFLSLSLAGNLLRLQFLTSFGQRLEGQNESESKGVEVKTHVEAQANKKRKREQHQAVLAATAEEATTAMRSKTAPVRPLSIRPLPRPLLALELDLRMNLFDSSCPVAKERICQLRAVPAWTVRSSESVRCRIPDGFCVGAAARPN